MANRHLTRSIVLQTLFEWDFHDPKEEVDVFSVLDRNLEEFGPGAEEGKFARELIELVQKKQKVIDQVIEKAAPDWPIDKINAVDRSILRLGLTELLFGDREQVPPKVAINEAIELAKSFGGDNSSKFINGVLGAVYKEIGEPGKEQTGKGKKKDTEPVDPKTLPVERKGGAIVYAQDGDTYKIALVHDVFGYWTLPKGGIEEDEDEKDGTMREIKEEIGLDIKIEDLLGENEYIASHPKKGKVRKRVLYYLASTPYKEVQLLNDSGGLDDARWFALTEIPDLTIYDDILPLLADAIKKITSS